MSDCVLDTTVVSLSNKELLSRQIGGAFDRALSIIEDIVSGTRRIRYNPRLVNEYGKHINRHNNDAIHVLFQLLDSDRAFFVATNSLRRHEYALAIRKCRWPSHDQHLIAAAIGGVDPSIFVTEARHAVCAGKVHRYLGIEIHHIT